MRKAKANRSKKKMTFHHPTYYQKLLQKADAAKAPDVSARNVMSAVATESMEDIKVRDARASGYYCGGEDMRAQLKEELAHAKDSAKLQLITAIAKLCDANAQITTAAFHTLESQNA